MLHGFMRSDTH